MAELSQLAIYVLAASLAAYAVVLIIKRNRDVAEATRIEQIEKIAQYFSASGSLESAIRQLAAEQPISAASFASLAGKVDEGLEIDAALFQAMGETSDDFFSKTCLMLISANRKNDPVLLYNSVQKIKEASALRKSIGKRSEIGSLTIQAVFCAIMPLIFFFMIGTLGIETDMLLDVFLGFIVLCSALFQGIVFRQWLETVIKVPLLLSLFYILYFKLAPVFLFGIVGPIF